MHRLLFEKSGPAVWISHLDMMRTIQRCFRRAGIRIKQTEGYSPHAFVSIALPLPVGTESQCELLDFVLETPVPLSELPTRLNPWMPEGVRVLQAVESDRKIRDLARLQAQMTLCYDAGVPADAKIQIEQLLQREQLLMEKKTKKGTMTELDLLPMLFASELTEHPKAIVWNVTVSAQNPSLNPELLIKAVCKYLPQAAPDTWRIRRLEILDVEGNPFR